MNVERKIRLVISCKTFTLVVLNLWRKEMLRTVYMQSSQLIRDTLIKFDIASVSLAHITVCNLSGFLWVLRGAGVEVGIRDAKPQIRRYVEM